MKEKNNNYVVLLFEEAIKELGPALEPYFLEGPVGKHLYCKSLEHLGGFIVLTFTPEQVQDRIQSEINIQIPSHFVKFIAYANDDDQKKIGFLKKDFKTKLSTTSF